MAGMGRGRCPASPAIAAAPLSSGAPRLFRLCGVRRCSSRSAGCAVVRPDCAAARVVSTVWVRRVSSQLYAVRHRSSRRVSEGDGHRRRGSHGAHAVHALYMADRLSTHRVSSLTHRVSSPHGPTQKHRSWYRHCQCLWLSEYPEPQL